MGRRETEALHPDLAALLSDGPVEVRDGVACALASADVPTEEDRGAVARVVHRVASHPVVYESIQRVVGTPRTRQLLGRHLAGAQGKTVLDAGAGTGRFRELLPPGATYVWLDNDPQKLAGFRAKRPRDPAILADATRMPLRDESVDYVVCVAVAHHLPADAFRLLVGELARVARERLLFVDAVRDDARVGTLLWRYDRGVHPRSADELLAALAERFDVEDVESYAKLHRYVFCAARPKGA